MGTKNISAASRIFNNRICLYLSSEAIADNFTEAYKGITIQDTFVKAEKLAMPTQKLILSNVCTPLRTNSSIVLKLIDQGIKKIHSAVSHLHVPVAKEVSGEGNYNHILSFQRSLFVVDYKDYIVPDLLTIKYEEETYRIFFSNNGDLRCYICKTRGHKSAKCPFLSNENTSNGNVDPPSSDILPSISKNCFDEQPNMQDQNKTPSKKWLNSIDSSGLTSDRKPSILDTTSLKTDTSQQNQTEHEQETIQEQDDTLNMPSPINATDLILEIKNQLQIRYQRYWQCSPHLLTNKVRILTETPDLYILPPWISRCFKTTPHLLCIGYTHLIHEHLSKSSPQLYSTCQIPLTVPHLLFECLHIQNYRCKYHLSNLPPLLLLNTLVVIVIQ